MKKSRIEKSWRKEIYDNKYLILLSLVFLIIAVYLNLLAGNYVNRTKGVVAPDLILDYLPVVNLTFFYSYGMILVLVTLFLYPLLFKIHKLHDTISQFSLLIMTRSIFICFTHLTPPAGALPITSPNFLSPFFFNNDLFFSGHTAVPFLGFLLFKDSKIKYFFLASSIVLASVVLLMREHYTIDVFSAFFITYGTFIIGEKFFSRINAHLKKRFDK